MPIYEYQCRACGHELEKLQKISDAVLVDCPQCNEPSLQRKVSAAGFRLKGGGWYETDFKKDRKKNIAGESAGASSSGGDSAASTPSKSGDSGGSSTTASA